ncbi:MAG TPA: SDR family NAD(P)-dependent oxidoreductase [Chthoniobacterales bacterium]
MKSKSTGSSSAAAKSALEGLSIRLAQEVGPLDIRVTAVAPGGFRTAFLSERSIRRSPATISAYDTTVGQALAHLDEIAGRQLGDLTRAASAGSLSTSCPSWPPWA